MRHLLLALAVSLLIATEAVAACVTHTIFYPSGRTVFCTTCCYGGVCTTNCF